MNPEFGQTIHQMVDLAITVGGGGFMGFALEICQRKFLEMWNLSPMENLQSDNQTEILRKLKRTDHRDVEANILEIFLSGLALNYAINSFQDGDIGMGVAASVFILTKMVDVGIHVAKQSSIFNMIMRHHMGPNIDE